MVESEEQKSQQATFENAAAMADLVSSASEREAQPENHHTAAILEILARRGVEGKVIGVDENIYLREVVILPPESEEGGSEPKVWVFRGVSELDDTLLRQAAIGMRVGNELGYDAVHNEALREPVQRLADDPNYVNLVAYESAAEPLIGPETAKRYRDVIDSIELEALRGRSVRSSLLHEQIKYGGGTSVSGPTPYLSASWDGREALGYGRSAVMVIEVPLSKVEDHHETGNETTLHGELALNDIRAIVPMPDHYIQKDKMAPEMDKVLAKIEAQTGIHPLSGENLVEARKQQRSERLQRDTEQLNRDVSTIRQARAKRFAAEFSETGLHPEEAYAESTERQIDPELIYLERMFDIYAARWDELAKEGRMSSLTEAIYDPPQGGLRPNQEQPRPFLREYVTRGMIQRMKGRIDFFDHKESRGR